MGVCKWVDEVELASPNFRQVAEFSEDGSRVVCISVRSFNAENDARLIAAAPAMLAALKDIKDFLRQSGYDTRLVREVIAAAEPTP